MAKVTDLSANENYEDYLAFKTAAEASLEATAALRSELVLLTKVGVLRAISRSLFSFTSSFDDKSRSASFTGL